MTNMTKKQMQWIGFAILSLVGAVVILINVFSSNPHSDSKPRDPTTKTESSKAEKKPDIVYQDVIPLEKWFQRDNIATDEKDSEPSYVRPTSDDITTILKENDIDTLKSWINKAKKHDDMKWFVNMVQYEDLFVDAVEFGHTEMVTLLMTLDGLKIDRMNRDYILHDPMKRKNFEMVMQLLTRSDTNLRDDYSNTALSYAIRFFEGDELKRMLNVLYKRDPFLFRTRESGPLQKASYRSIDTFEQVVAYMPNQVNDYDQNFVRPLERAIWSGNVPMVEYMLARDDVYPNIITNRGETIFDFLDERMQFKSPENIKDVVDLIYKHKEQHPDRWFNDELNEIIVDDNQIKHRRLSYLIETGNLKECKRLLDKYYKSHPAYVKHVLNDPVKFDNKVYERMTYLQQAIILKKPSFVSLFLKYGADPSSCVRTPPLVVAINTNDVFVVKALLNDPKTNPNDYGLYNDDEPHRVQDLTPLSKAIMNDNNQIAKVLMKHSKIDVNQISNWSYDEPTTAVDVAAAYNRCDMLNELLAMDSLILTDKAYEQLCLNADEFTVLKYITDKRFKLKPEHVYRAGYQNSRRVMRYLLNNGLEDYVMYPSEYGWTALHRAAYEGNDKTVDVLLKGKHNAKVNPYIYNSKKELPLELAYKGKEKTSDPKKIKRYDRIIKLLTE